MAETGSLNILAGLYFDYIFTAANCILVLFVVILASFGVKLVRLYFNKLLIETNSIRNKEVINQLGIKFDDDSEGLKILLEDCFKDLIEENRKGNPLSEAVISDFIEPDQFHGIGLVDELTGAFNRKHFKEFAREHDKTRGEKGSFLFCNINGIRTINKVEGYEEGDNQIKMIVETIRHSMPDDSKLFRISGDEFLVYMPSVLMNEADNISRYINDNIIGRPDMKVDIAIGIATKVSDFQSIDFLITSAEENMQRNKLLAETSIRSNLIDALMNVLGEKSYETEEHCIRIKEYAVKIGEKMGLIQSQMNSLVLLSYLHDIGKVSVPDSVLMKPTRLTKEEWNYMKKHSESGAKIIRGIPDLGYIAEAVHSHHENWDGTGYPRGLKKEEIPLISRIIRVVDSYDAMSHARIYSVARPRSEVMDEIKRCSGTMYDPDIVEVFMEINEGSLQEEFSTDNMKLRVIK